MRPCVPFFGSDRGKPPQAHSKAEIGHFVPACGPDKWSLGIPTQSPPRIKAEMALSGAVLRSHSLVELLEFKLG